MRKLIPVLLVLFAIGLAFGVVSVQDRATLTVSMSGRGPGYFEGAYSYFAIRSKGAPVELKRFTGSSMSFSLSPGVYQLVSYVRPCDGNCGFLDPPTDECRGTFSLKAKETLYAIRQQTAAGPCKVAFSSMPPSGKD